MSIKDTMDWQSVELAAQLHELNHVESPKVQASTQAQQLLFAVTRCAELQARLHLLKGQTNEALIYLTAGQPDRAKQVLARSILDL